MFNQRIKELRKSQGLSMEELAEKYNRQFDGKMNKSTLSRYENNLQEPMINVVRNLAEFFNVPIGYLTGEEWTEKSIFDYDNIVPLPQMKTVPLIGNIACGSPILAEENIADYIKCPSNIDADYALHCKGDSMINARIFDGDIVFIRQQSDVDDGEIAAVLIGDETTLKRVFHKSNRIRLKPENPTYEELEFEGEELEQIRILGKAIYFLSAVR